MVPTVFVPGLLCDQTVWAYQISHLKDLISPTVISFKDGDTPSKRIDTILKQAPARFALIGHSMGGWLSLEIMRRAPERVEKLILLNTTARPDSSDKQSRRKQMIEMAKTGQFSLLVKQLSEAMVFQKAHVPVVYDMFLASGAKRLIDDEMAMLQRDESMSILPKIRVPTWIIHARRDQIFSLEEHQEMASLISHAKWTIVEDSGHMSPIEQPQAITALIRLAFCEANR